MHIPLCCNEKAKLFFGEKLYHPKKTHVQKIDNSVHERWRERHIWILYGNQMTSMICILKLLSIAFTKDYVHSRPKMAPFGIGLSFHIL